MDARYFGQQTLPGYRRDPYSGALILVGTRPADPRLAALEQRIVKLENAIEELKCRSL